MGKGSKKTAFEAEKAKKRKQENILMLSGIAISLVIIALVTLVVWLCTRTLYDIVDNTIYTDTNEVTDHVRLRVSYTSDNGRRHVGDIVVKLDAESAPLTVANFQKLVGENYYKDLTFHRVISGFMIQGGDGGSAKSIKGEFSSNGVQNNLKHERGVISMARTNDPDSASSQFFIVHDTAGATHLDGDYAAFGYVVFGMESVDGIAAVSVDEDDKPLRQVTLESATFVKIAE